MPWLADEVTRQVWKALTRMRSVLDVDGARSSDISPLLLLLLVAEAATFRIPQ